MRPPVPAPGVTSASATGQEDAVFDVVVVRQELNRVNAAERREAGTRAHRRV